MATDIASTELASAAYRRYLVWLLFAIAVVNYFDRQIVNILAEQIKRDLGLADWQLGLLTGLSFAALYTLVGIPIAIFADRSNRSRIITASLAFWSVFTAVCGLAQTFTQLLLSRVAVGLGEAGCQPPSHSLIAEYTPMKERSRAMGIYALGIPAGSLMALAAGGILAERMGWRSAFFIAGIPGILLAALAFFTLRDPEVRVSIQERRSIRVSLAELKGNPVFWWLSIGSACMALVSYGQLAFFGSFFLRVHGRGLTELSSDIDRVSELQLGPTALVGVGLGLIIGVAGLLGAYVGGRLGDHFGRRSPSALMWIPAISAPLCIPFYIAAFTVSSTPLAFALLFPPKLLGYLWLAPAFAAMQSVVAPDARATASAFNSSIVLLFGLGIGPVTIGALSDGFSAYKNLGEAQGVRWALICGSLVCAVAALFFSVAASKMKRATLS